MNNEAYVKDTTKLRSEYDFIIIGAGSGGSVVANRLSEVSNWNVLLLEAGGNENELIDFPALFAYHMASDVDWKYQTAPSSENNPYCLAMKNRRCNWARGKILGGSSAINAMLYIRGNRHDFEQWERLGNPGWSYADILPYFRKSEDNKNQKYVNSRYHDVHGLLTVSEATYRTPLADTFLQGGRELGYETQDVNGRNQTGFMISQATLRNGARCSAARAFLRSARKRRNLHVSMHCHVTKIIIDPTTKTAKGVEFVRNNRKFVIKATKEVLVSAGAIASPQLLMLSGIGPREHLEEHNIPVVQELKVGDNLQDHYGMGGLQFLIDKPIAIDVDKYLDATNIVNYISKQTGPLASLTGECVAFINTKYANKSMDWPDMQFDYGPINFNADPVQVIKVTNLREDFYYPLYGQMGKGPAFNIVPNIMRPYSRGYIRLRSNNPFQHPLINPNYFSDRRDVDIILDGIRMALKLANTRSFQQHKATLHSVPMPGCQHLIFDSDEYWECCLRHFTFTLWHFSGTCKMGPETDPDAVVDARLRVRGIKGLRVIDASIMPVVTTGNINAVVYMIAEKGADMIKKDWNII